MLLNLHLTIRKRIAIAAIGLVATTLQSCVSQPSTNGVVSPTTTSPAASASPTSTQSPSSQPSGSDRPSPASSPQAVSNTTNRSATVETEVCVVGMAIINDPNPPINVRSSPDANADNVVTTLTNGTYVTVNTEKDGWFQISNPAQGWISKSRTDHNCGQKVAQIDFPANGGSITVSDRFIGTGSHRYIVNASAGQTLTIATQEGAFPTITGPDGEVLDPGGNDAPSQWSQSIPAKGEYTLEFISNFKGYDYAFSAQLK